MLIVEANGLTTVQLRNGSDLSVAFSNQISAQIGGRVDMYNFVLQKSFLEKYDHANDNWRESFPIACFQNHLLYA